MATVISGFDSDCFIACVQPQRRTENQQRRTTADSPQTGDTVCAIPTSAAAISLLRSCTGWSAKSVAPMRFSYSPEGLQPQGKRRSAPSCSKSSLCLAYRVPVAERFAALLQFAPCLGTRRRNCASASQWRSTRPWPASAIGPAAAKEMSKVKRRVPWRLTQLNKVISSEKVTENKSNEWMMSIRDPSHARSAFLASMRSDLS